MTEITDRPLTIIHHSADYDGIFCREIARKFRPEANLIGWDFGDPPIEIVRLDGHNVIVMDLPLDRPFGLDQPAFSPTSNVVWIDHHKSAIESHDPTFAGRRIDGVAACRLAWQWFSGEPPRDKDDFVNRRVLEPLAVRLAGEYDIWDKRDPNADTFQYGLRLVDPGSDFWEALLEIGPVGINAVRDTLEHGAIAQRYAARVDADVTRKNAYLMNWEGLRFLVLNSARFNSQVFAALDVPETGHDALLGYRFNGTKWTVSLYHAKHRTDLDLSEIAVRHGGGGHRGACGFTSTEFPFEPTALELGAAARSA